MTTVRIDNGVVARSAGRGASRAVWSRSFICICLVTFLAYANNSVFFSFYEYLKTLPIAPESFGLLIAVFSAVSLVVRPVMSPFVHSGNARRLLFAGTLMVAVALAAYSLALNFWSMLLVRILHGLAFVVMGTALMALTIDFIPRKRSAQIFGLLAIVILVPNTIVPPVLPLLDRSLGGFTGVLLFFALVTLLIFPLIKSLKKPAQDAVRGQAAESALTRQEIWQDIRDPAVAVLLIAMLLFFSTHALVFFFLDAYGRSLGISATGLFLTLATASEIGVRLAAGSLFDRLDKCLLAAGALLGLAVAYAVLGHVRGPVGFFILGGVLGVGWGIAMPVFNGLMFDMSAPRFRAFNLNLGLQMFQGGFFLGPFIGGPVAAKFGFAALFSVCAGLSLLSLVFTVYLRSESKK
jgi:predicted MFS family arabinose efflux permease